MIKERDYSLDFFKGIAVISIVFIHTVWWSGQGYVPGNIAQLSLLIDVPLFFFLSGASATFAFNKPNPFSGIIRLLSLFALSYAIYACIFEKNAVFKFYLQSLFLQFNITPKVAVLYGSSWFIPVFAAIYLLAYFIVTYVGKKNMLPLICILLLVFLYKCSSIEAFKGLQFLNVAPSNIFAALFFFLFGYYYYKELRLLKMVRWFGVFLLVVSLGVSVYYFRDIPFDLQSLKFPMSFFYVIISLISISLVIILAPFIKKGYAINYLGKNALQFYLAQTLSSSLIFIIIPHIHFNWQLQLTVVFLINLALAFIFTIAITFIFNYYLIAVAKIFSMIDNFSLSEVKQRSKEKEPNND